MRTHQALRRWLSQVCDPVRAFKGFLGLCPFFL